ncbi:MAG: hypothetical protein C4521_05070 [Actinobacteria bacterium]|nr:MAG: hypothetical protein C4521_05070 [Actinomycetota bacterium]
MKLTDARYIPHTVAAAFLAAVVIAALAPAEAKLGDTVKLIYLHASITWVALAVFAAAALTGIAALLVRSETLSAWSRASLATATVYWLGHFVIGLVVMKLAWGGWFWSEPRVRAGMLILGVAIAATLVALSVDKSWAAPALSIGVLIFIYVLLASVGRVFHPQGAIRSSESLAIKGAVAAILFLVGSASLQIARLLRELGPVKE